jgi:hypothetical protein
MMNEPYYMPKPGQIVEAFEGWDQDLTIWPTFAKATIAEMRKIDTTTPIYVGGNHWNTAWTLGTDNPGFPIVAPNIVHEVHCYLDAFNSGNGLDWDIEEAKQYTAGLDGGVPINSMTGVNRLKPAVEFAKQHGLRLALTETGMPVDDPRWQESWTNLLKFARDNNVEFYSWPGGAHWTQRARPLNHIPGWHQNRTMEPQQAGPMKSVAGVNNAVIFDDGGGWAPNGGSVTITVHARGALAMPVVINVASDKGGSFSKTMLVIPAGANGQDSFTFSPPLGTVATLSYTSATAPNVPPPRKVFALADPVAYASVNLADAAMALIAKYAACKWEMAHGYTDHLQGLPAAAGQSLRAVSDSGYGSAVGRQMEMLNWFNTGPGMGDFSTPVKRMLNGRPCMDLTAANAFGLWCRKTWLIPESLPRARNIVPYHVNDPHFAIAAVAVPSPTSGIVFQASAAEHLYLTELRIDQGRPQARWVDGRNETIVLTSPTALQPNAPAVISLVCTAGSQKLRVESQARGGTGTQTFVPTGFGNNQMLLGSGFDQEYPRDGFHGYLFSTVTGKGAPTDAEMNVMERYLATTAGI